MPFKSKGRDFYKTRITLPDGRSGVFGCGTSDLDTALAVERMVKALLRKGNYRPLELVIERKAKLTEVFYAYESNRLDQFVAEFSSRDLSSLLSEWHGHAKYKKQIRRMIPEGQRFPASDFGRRAISEFLSGLQVSGSTRNRYRAALSVFAGWLVEREIIPHNPVRDVRGYKPNAARMVWLDRGQARALIASLPMPYRAIEALMAATGVEWQAIERLTGRDVDLKNATVHARGGKTAWRNRLVRPTEAWAWAIFADYAKTFSPSAPLFTTREDTALRVHKRASEALGLPKTTLHDWRHTYAVQALRDGLSPTVVARQLGHRDSYLVLTRYGRFVPDESDYRRHTASFHAEGRDDRESSNRSTTFG